MGEINIHVWLAFCSAFKIQVFFFWRKNALSKLQFRGKEAFIFKKGPKNKIKSRQQQ